MGEWSMKMTNCKYCARMYTVYNIRSNGTARLTLKTGPFFNWKNCHWCFLYKTNGSYSTDEKGFFALLKAYRPDCSTISKNLKSKSEYQAQAPEKNPAKHPLKLKTDSSAFSSQLSFSCSADYFHSPAQLKISTRPQRHHTLSLQAPEACACLRSRMHLYTKRHVSNNTAVFRAAAHFHSQTGRLL